MALDPTEGNESLGVVQNEPLDMSSIHPMLSAANNHTIAATNGGTFLGELSDGLTKGVAASLVSAGVSIANSAVAIGNIFGAGASEIKTKDVLLGLDDNLAGYYDLHKEGVDIAGEVLGGIAPGLGGIKLLKLAQAGVAGNNVMRTTNLFRSMQAQSLNLAKSEIANGTVFETYNAARLKAILAGAGDQALQAIAFEMGVATTMQLAPALNKDSVDVMGFATGFAKNTALSAIFGGALGGVFEAAAVKGQLNRFLRLESKNIRPFEVTDDIGRLDIDSGTRISQMQWQLEQKGKLYDTGVPLTEKEFRTLGDTIKKMETSIRLEMQNLTGGDAALANKLYDQLKSLPADEFANALTGSSKVGRIVDLIPEDVPKYIPAHKAPLKIKNTQLIYDISATSSKGEVIASDGLVPSVADYAAKGTIQRMANGDIRAGQGNIFKLKGERVEDLEPLDASAKWTSYALAPKMEDGVVLDGSNLPQLQRALIDKPKEFSKVNFGGYTVESLDDLPIYIRAKKEQAVEKMLREEKSVDVIARTLDVDKAFVEDTTKGNWNLFGITDYSAPQYAVATFAKVPKGLDLFGIEGIKNTQLRIQLARENAYATTASYFKDELNQLPKMHVDTASPVDRGSGFFTSAQGLYGSIQSAAEQVGRFVTGKAYRHHQENVDLLFSARKAIQNDPRLLAEFNAVVGRLRGTEDKFVFDSTGLVFDGNTIISRSYMQDVEKTLLAASKGTAIDSKAAAADILKGKVREPNLDEKIVLPPEIADYFRTHMQINDNRVIPLKNLMNARGQTSSLSSGTIYVPAVDTTKQNFVAFVKMPDGKFGGTSEKASIVAPTAEALQRKIDLIKNKYGNQFEIYTKKEAEEYFKVKGEYDTQLMFNEPAINSALQREGVLSDIVPRTDAYVFDEFERWHFRQEQGLIRGMTELHYGQEFAELQALGKQYTDIVTSRALNVSTKTVKNPYEDITRTALGISRLPENKLWMQLNEFVEATGTKMFNTIQEVFISASKGSISWEEANKAMEKYGYKAPYSDLYSLQLANTKIAQPVLQPFIQKANGVMATAVLRLDFLDTIMNVISAPALLGAEVSHIRKNLSNPEIVGKLSELMSVAAPGSGAPIPTTFKLLNNAISNYFKNPQLLQEYKAAGWIKNELDLHRELIDTAALKGHETASQLNAIGKKMVDIGVKLTGNDWSQGFTRFIAADVMRQIGTIAKLPQDELVAYMNTFVNRVMGNMTASQRPVMFQGAIGNAIGLFQTFQFNMAQNVFRYLENGDKKAVGLLLGMQNSLYGLQSNPAFYAVNTHLVGANTKGHEDIISGTYKVVGKDIGNWIMYGLGSNALSTNIYSRGDLTPRFASVVPTTIGDIPIVSATARFATSIWDTAQKLTQVGNKGDVLLQGLAQMSINRPLAGIAQVASGTVVTKDAGNLISASNDTFSLASLSRVAGGKPLDEAIAVDAMYRRNVYKAMDRDKLETLGAAVKTKMRGDGADLTQQDWKDLSNNYASAGGRVENFNGWVHRQMIAANTSVMNKVRQQLTDPTVQNMMAVMGGELPDFRNLRTSGNPVAQEP